MTGRPVGSVGVAAAALVALLALLSGAAPARAADEVGLSPDGVSWYDALRRPLFDSGARWVPGDAETASFYVRNEGSSAAQLTIEVRDANGGEVRASAAVDIDARTAGGRWFAVENGPPSSALTDRAIAEGGQVRVDVRVRFRWQAPNGSMLDRLPLSFEVRLIQAGPSGGDPHADGPSGLLPPTGSPVSWVVAWLVVLLIGSGFALVVAARRRRERESEEGCGG